MGTSAAASSSNPITAQHKMALDEACNILNVHQPSAAPVPETELQTLLKVRHAIYDLIWCC